jgi:hypothetical protein
MIFSALDAPIGGVQGFFLESKNNGALPLDLACLVIFSHRPIHPLREIRICLLKNIRKDISVIQVDSTMYFD